MDPQVTPPTPQVAPPQFTKEAFMSDIIEILRDMLLVHPLTYTTAKTEVTDGQLRAMAERFLSYLDQAVSQAQQADAEITARDLLNDPEQEELLRGYLRQSIKEVLSQPAPDASTGEVVPPAPAPPVDGLVPPQAPA